LMKSAPVLARFLNAVRDVAFGIGFQTF